MGLEPKKPITGRQIFLPLQFSLPVILWYQAQVRPMLLLTSMNPANYCLWSGLYLNHIEILQDIISFCLPTNNQGIVSITLQIRIFCRNNNFNLGSSCIVSTHCLLYRLLLPPSSPILLMARLFLTLARY